MDENKKIEDSWVAWLAGEIEEQPNLKKGDESAFRELEDTWNIAGTAYSYRNSNPDKGWSKISEEINIGTKVVSLKRFNYLRYAAIFIALFALGSLTFLLTRNRVNIPELQIAEGPAMKIIRTVSKPLAFTIVILPDGSTVRINANSSLQYPEKFTGNHRIVKLSGEAFFDVIHDASNPFIVEINNVEVQDLGTSFNISAYPEKKQVEVNVVTGSVSICDKNQKAQTILAAGSSGKLMTERGNISVSKELSPNFMAWITKTLSFHHTPLATVFETLENIYHVPIEITDPKIADISYTANFEKFQLEDIVNIIARTHHLSVKKQADGFVFATK